MLVSTWAGNAPDSQVLRSAFSCTTVKRQASAAVTAPSAWPANALRSRIVTAIWTNPMVRYARWDLRYG